MWSVLKWSATKTQLFSCVFKSLLAVTVAQLEMCGKYSEAFFSFVFFLGIFMMTDAIVLHSVVVSLLLVIADVDLLLKVLCLKLARCALRT